MQNINLYTSFVLEGISLIYIQCMQLIPLNLCFIYNTHMTLLTQQFLLVHNFQNMQMLVSSLYQERCSNCSGRCRGEMQREMLWRVNCHSWLHELRNRRPAWRKQKHCTVSSRTYNISMMPYFRCMVRKWRRHRSCNWTWRMLRKCTRLRWGGTDIAYIGVENCAPMDSTYFCIFLYFTHHSNSNHGVCRMTICNIQHKSKLLQYTS